MSIHTYILNLKRLPKRLALCQIALRAQGFPPEKCYPFQAVDAYEFETLTDLCEDAIQHGFECFEPYTETRDLYNLGVIAQAYSYCKFLEAQQHKTWDSLLIQDRRQLYISYNDLIDLRDTLKSADPDFYACVLSCVFAPHVTLFQEKFIKNGHFHTSGDWAQLITPTGATELLKHFQKAIANLNPLYETFIQNSKHHHVYSTKDKLVDMMDNIDAYPSSIHLENIEGPISTGRYYQLSRRLGNNSKLLINEEAPLEE